MDTVCTYEFILRFVITICPLRLLGWELFTSQTLFGWVKVGKGGEVGRWVGGWVARGTARPVLREPDRVVCNHSSLRSWARTL